MLVVQSCLTLCDPMDCRQSGSSVHGILQERIPEWVDILFSRGSSWPSDRTWVSCITGRFFTVEPPGKPWLKKSKCYRGKFCGGIFWYSSVQFSHSVVSDSLQPHGLQHARPPCPSPTPRAHSNSCHLSRWCHPAISSSVIPFSSLLQSFLASESLLTKQQQQSL